MHLVVKLAICAGLGLCSASGFAQQAGNPFEGVSPPDEQIIGDPDRDDLVPPVVAPDQSVQQSRDREAFTIGAVSVKSGIEIAAGDLARAYEPFIGEEASEDKLRDLANTISEIAREKGYIFASAHIPAQSVKIGVVEVLLDPGAIDEVRIIGSENRRLRKILDRLKNRPTLATRVERQLLFVADLPGITLLNSNYRRENGKGILVVSVREDKAKGHLALDNFGPETLGPFRARLDLDIAGLLTDGDILTTNVISSIVQPKELTYVNARYAVTLGDGATVVGISAAAGRTHSGGNLADFEFTGQNRYASGFVSHAVKRGRDVNLWINGEVAFLDARQSQNGTIFQNEQIATAAVNISGNYNIGVGRIYGGVGITQGLGILGANRLGDPLNSRNDGSGIFTKGNFWINSIFDLGDGFGLRLAGNAQIASRPLLSSNELAVGGPYFGKGYDFSERFGDEGAMGLAEVRKEFKKVNEWLDWFQLYAFVDGGHASNKGTGFGDGSLASAGGGIRAQIGKLDLGIEAAAPLTRDRFESGDRSPKISFQIGLRF
ncbi:ShlB/FhaC/HecB family hemolysin secretion/activation protein [uncultured Parasphingorhabdus sp.]|uniref:ShlB/FhaC/HecB family hemolysin secretion/activation protein n=1 Tax=uncultured Parasphingorhabdus sp. TaxID=2709694 RepID=UPI0030DA9244